ncbi:hypothetical protein KSP39_PZI002911 [Platanthera zijinensis]|uniref:Uncharacterized protein n=1 Tax=Platanthera zijinensis TaxID=2320716 RepID=A0AAP0GEK6_9ASPA
MPSRSICLTAFSPQPAYSIRMTMPQPLPSSSTPPHVISTFAPPQSSVTFASTLDLAPTSVPNPAPPSSPPYTKMASLQSAISTAAHPSLSATNTRDTRSGALITLLAAIWPHQDPTMRLPRFRTHDA